MSKTGKTYNNICRILLYLLVIECTVGGSGRIVILGPLSLRIALFVASFVITFPLVIKNLRELISNKWIQITIVFGIFLAICAVFGYYNGNNVQFIKQDITTFLYLAIIPGYFCVFDSKDDLISLVKIVYYSTVVLAFVTVFLHFFLQLLNNNTFINNLNIWLNATSIGGMSTMFNGMQRIYFKSGIYYQVALLIGVWLFSLPGYKKPLIIFYQGLLFTAMMISLTRGFWLGFAGSVVVLLVIYPQCFKIGMEVAYKTLIVFICFILVSSLVYKSPVIIENMIYRLNPKYISIFRIIDDNKEDSNVPSDPSASPQEDIGNNKEDQKEESSVITRKESIIYAVNEIKKSPIIGHGLGKNLDGLRTKGRIEYVFLDILLKMGIIGEILFVSTFYVFIPKYLNIRRTNYANCFLVSVLVMAFIGVTITSITNPFIISPLGINLLIIVELAVLLNEKSIERGQ